MHLPFFAAVFALKPSFKYGELTSQQAGGGAGKTNYMWYKLGQWVLKYRVALLILLLAASGFMAWQASKVQLSYEFTKAIPSNNPKYQEYLAFKAQFGEDGNVLVVGVQDSAFFAQAHMQAYRQALQLARQVPGVAGVLAVPMAVNLYRADTADKLLAAPIFTDSLQSQPAYDSARTLFENLLFYKGLLYNPNSKAYLALLTIQKEVLASKARTQVVAGVQQAFAAYQQATGVGGRYSGLPYIRTRVADRVKAEMYWFLIGSLALATITLILFFRSVSATLISLVVVALGVIWAVGTMHLLGYQITLLNALIPPLMIVIGIPNCIYFLNKYHMSWEDIQGQAGAGATPNAAQLKRQAILNMVGKMGVVTLFCNIAAAVGFAVFALTESALLKEFGAVAGIGIMAIFVISFILIPAALSYLPPPKERHTRYLRNRFLENLLVKVEYWVLQHRKMVYLITAVVLVAAIAGILRLQSVGFIVDDLPKKDKIYTDLKWFEQNFGGVMPLEIVVDARKKNGITRNLQTIQRIDELSAYLDSLPQTARPLSLLEGLKFAKQAYYDGDSL
ncbi:MAG TPA: efflux RND transporter permease subunit, partial [Phnomibacter sp.]|nr:efflux RND transporter permease subunit [Phnomibacter sp.]